MALGGTPCSLFGVIRGPPLGIEGQVSNVYGVSQRIGLRRLPRPL